MKTYLNMTVALIILVGGIAASAHAQTAGTPRVLANIPFAFNVGNTSLPAGKYAVTVLNPTSDRKILQIRSSDGRSTAIILTTGVIGKTSDDAKLVFRRYGNQYFFSQAQMAGERLGLAALKSSAERAQEHAVAAASKKSVVVIFAE